VVELGVEEDAHLDEGPLGGDEGGHEAGEPLGIQDHHICQLTGPISEI
jgi:hypothetical protein